MKNPSRQPIEHHPFHKPERDEAPREVNFQKENTPAVNPQAMSRLPIQGAGKLRRSVVLQMQRHLGNGFVQRQLAKSREVIQRSADAAAVQRQEENDQGSGPTAIGDGSASVSAESGQVKAEGGMIDLGAPMVRAPGVLQVETIIANSVVGSSYTPGAGNIW